MRLRFSNERDFPSNLPTEIRNNRILNVCFERTFFFLSVHIRPDGNSPLSRIRHVYRYGLIAAMSPQRTGKHDTR